MGLNSVFTVGYFLLVHSIFVLFMESPPTYTQVFAQALIVSLNGIFIALDGFITTESFNKQLPKIH